MDEIERKGPHSGGFLAIQSVDGDELWSDRYWTSGDGLTLHYRDYKGRADRPAVVCIPGLTRNARDFEGLAQAFCGEWRIVCVELRGRGQSEYAKDPATYTPEQYAADILTLIDELSLEKLVLVGTSLGGVIAMLIALQKPEVVAGVVLNDIGPEVEQSGVERIKETAGYGRSFPTWIHAAWALRKSTSIAHPDYEISDWIEMAKRLLRLSGSGRISYDYDMKITEAFQQQLPDEMDLWPAFESLAGRPVLTLRGEFSDILSEQTLQEMQKKLPDMAAVTIAGVGHVPTLSENEAQSAIADLLAKLA